ncbi:tripartite motif-containing protein 35-like isoform X3 [Thalassophryne amazonica]|uniref:tripartite motif-containing protein 35-like isoform X3 n=1 Tax=Thalassophryne amazonica TaxID=390379 RepID=UPI001471C2F1|nr:tripartite motif-containing protein 35-like isoform X3 [Thalassophryne amazonica]
MEFQKLYQVLRTEEIARIEAVKKEETFKTLVMTIRIVNLNAEISCLNGKVKSIKEAMKDKDLSFMLNVKRTMEQAKCDLPEPKTPSSSLINEAEHVGNLLYKVWMKLKSTIQYTPVTLDPNTASIFAVLSEQLTRSTESEKAQQLPENPERQCSSTVCGSEAFSSGKHSWDVEVQSHQTEKVIKKEFQKLYQILRTEEIARIEAVKKEETLKTDAMTIRIENLNAEISSLSDKIKSIEEAMKDKDLSFMLNVKTAMERAKCDLSEPRPPSSALINEAEHVGNLLYKVWMKLKSTIQYSKQHVISPSSNFDLNIQPWQKYGITGLGGCSSVV